MKNDPSNTPNASSEGVDAEALDELVRGIRSRGPSSDAVQRITKRLAAAGALAPTAISDTPPAAPSKVTVGMASKVGYYKAGALALAVAAGSLLAWRATSSSTEMPSAVVASSENGAASSAPKIAGEPSAPEAHAPASAEPTAPSAISVPAVSIDALPSAAPTTRASATAPIARAMTDSANVETSTPEHLLVRRAQDALSADPARALSLADEHAARYPSGELTQEREVVAVDALAKLGRKSDALLRARALLRRFPRTPYVAHLEKAVGQPLAASGGRDGSAKTDSRPTP